MTKNPSELLKIRKKVKSRKPKFIRQDAHKKKKLGKKWRKPKGLHSKIRLAKKGYCRKVKKGWKSPRAIRGYTKTGLSPVRINSLKQLKDIKENQGIVISRRVGERKKRILLQKIKELNLKLINIKDVNKALEKIENKIKQKKETKKQAEARKKEAEKKKEAKKKQGLSEKVSAEEKKQPKETKEEPKEIQNPEEQQKAEAKKKEFDKLLTKRT